MNVHRFGNRARCLVWLVACIAAGISVRADVTLEEITVGGCASYRVTTPNATWVYDREGGGFSSLIDGEGHDWISYQPAGGAAGNFRGIPNAVHHRGQAGNNFFHPGHTGPQASTTLVGARTPDCVVLRTESCDQRWRCEWEIRADRAVLRFTKVPADDPDYWFLYEGTPGGRFDATDLCVRPGAVSPLADKWEASLPEVPWVAFVSRSTQCALILVAHAAPSVPVSYRPMQDAMTVFGFGRTLKNLDGQLKQPVEFTVALVAEADPGRVAQRAAELLRR